MLTALEILGYVVLYVILYACLSRPFRRPKLAHLVAAGTTGIAFLTMTLLPEKDMHAVQHYMMLVPGIIIFLFVMLPLGWLALRVLRSNDSFLQKMAATLLIAAAQSFLIWLIVSFMIFNSFLGGDPFRGKVVGDAYYFGRGGDEYIRVTPGIWWISFWVLVALHCIPPLCLVSGLVLTWLSRLRDKTKSSKSPDIPRILKSWARFDTLLAWVDVRGRHLGNPGTQSPRRSGDGESYPGPADPNNRAEQGAHREE